MKKLTTLILFLLIAQISFGQIDNTTKNKIKAYYFTAENLYEKGEYSKTLDKISEIEDFGVKLATSQNLKVKTLVKLKQYQKAKEELDVLYSLNPNKEIYGDIAEYSSKIDTGLESEKLKEQERIKATEAKVIRRRELLKNADFSPYYSYPGSNAGIISENGSYGFVDLSGNILVPITYKNHQVFEEKLTKYRVFLMRGHNDLFYLYIENEFLFSSPSISHMAGTNNNIYEVSDNNRMRRLYSVRDKKWISGKYDMIVIKGTEALCFKTEDAYYDWSDGISGVDKIIDITNYL